MTIIAAGWRNRESGATERRKIWGKRHCLACFRHDVQGGAKCIMQNEVLHHSFCEVGKHQAQNGKAMPAGRKGWWSGFVVACR